MWQCHCHGLGLISLRAARGQLHPRAAILSSVKYPVHIAAPPRNYARTPNPTQETETTTGTRPSPFHSLSPAPPLRYASPCHSMATACMLVQEIRAKHKCRCGMPARCSASPSPHPVDTCVASATRRVPFCVHRHQGRVPPDGAACSPRLLHSAASAAQTPAGLATFEVLCWKSSRLFRCGCRPCRRR